MMNQTKACKLFGITYKSRILKSIETKAVFTTTEMNNERNVNFLQIVLLIFNTLIQLSFP